MKSKTLILMAVVIACGLATRYMTSRVTAVGSTKDAESEKPAALMKNEMTPVGLIMSDKQIVGGFILPNSHVDIVSVVVGSNGETYSKIILQNTLVLAVDRKLGMPTNIVTVQVTREQAAQIALAMQMGPLRLIHRRCDEEDGPAAGAGFLRTSTAPSSLTIRLA